MNFTCARGVAWPSGLRRWFKAPVSSEAWVRIPPLPNFFLTKVCHLKVVMRNETAKLAQKLKCQKNVRGHTDLNHGPIGLQPIALPLSYIPIC